MLIDSRSLLERVVGRAFCCDDFHDAGAIAAGRWREIISRHLEALWVERDGDAGEAWDASEFAEVSQRRAA